MKNLFFLTLILFAGISFGDSTQTSEQSHEARALLILFSTVQKDLLSAADAMPATKYSFVPTVGEFKDVRTFAEQLKHLGATNHILAAAALGENPPIDAGDEIGPSSLHTKSEIINYVKDSFLHLEKAIHAIDDPNPVVYSSPISPLRGADATRSGLIVEALIHSFDHYGQIVIYLRMNDVIPPASR